MDDSRLFERQYKHELFRKQVHQFPWHFCSFGVCNSDHILAKAPQFFHVQIPDEQQEETVLFQSSGSTIEFLFQFVLRLNFGPYWNSGNTFSCRTEIRNLNICSSRILYDFSNSFLVCLAHQHSLQQFHRAGSGRF